MKLKLKNIVTISFLAIAGLFGVTSTVINNQVSDKQVVEKAEAATTYTLIGGHNYWATTDYDDVPLTDSDGDGVYSATLSFQANDEWKIRQDKKWETVWARGCLASFPTGSFWGTGQDESNSNIHVVTAGSYRIDFTPSLGSIEVWNSSDSPSFKTFRLLVPSDWGDWSNNVRVHWWGNSSYESNFRAGKKFVNTSQSYTTGSVSGTIYSARVLSNITGVKVAKADISAETADLTVSGTDDFAAYLSYNDGNKLVSFDYIADGYYLRGIYQGNEDWSNNAVLSNSTVTESISYNSSEAKLHATLELYAGDTFKFKRYQGGEEQEWVGAASVESADSTYYPVSQDGDANFVVSNAGIYYLTLAYDNTSGGSQYWWCYFDNTASAYAYEFLNSMTCDPTGVSGPTWKQIPDKEDYYSWEYFSDYYNDHLDDYAKNTFYRATSNKNGTNIEKAVARYQIIVHNHGYTPFMGNSSGVLRSATRTFSPFKLVTNGDGENNLSALIIIISSSVAILSITALSVLVIKKKKQH